MTYSFPALSAGVSTSSTLTTTFRTLQMNFGDGYSQTANDGINYAMDTWTLNWTSMTKADMTSLITFFNTVGSNLPITWTSPVDTVAKTYKVDISTGISVQPQAGNVFSVSAKLVQVF